MKMYKALGAVVLTFMMCATVMATPEPDSAKAVDAGANKARPSRPDLIFNRKLVSTSVSLGNDVVVIGSGKVAIDSPLSFVCPRGGCTITAEMHLQMGENTTANNLMGLCADLDGSDMPPGCPNVVILPTDNLFVGGSFGFAQSGITAGTHTVQGFVYTTFGATRAFYDITYRLYTP